MSTIDHNSENLLNDVHNGINSLNSGKRRVSQFDIDVFFTVEGRQGLIDALDGLASLCSHLRDRISILESEVDSLRERVESIED